MPQRHAPVPNTAYAQPLYCPGECSRRWAEEQQQSLFFIDESGFYPLPSVVRTYAPVGQTPILREWWARDHLSAISAISPEGKLYFH